MRRVGKQIYRIGDLVEIVSPEMFVRCDYPLSYDIAKNVVVDLLGDDIKNFKYELYQKLCNSIKSSTFFEMKSLDNNFLEISENRFTEGVNKLLAYEKVYLESFGGTERKVITEYIEDYKGHQGVIVNKKIVQSGKYSVVSKFDIDTKRYMYDKKLEKRERHVIIDIACSKVPYKMLKIEDIHVKRIHEINFIDTSVDLT